MDDADFARAVQNAGKKSFDVVGTSADQLCVGDVNSEARGSGARFNAGKMLIQYVPMRTLLDMVGARYEPNASLFLRTLGDAIASFEEGDDNAAAGALELLAANGNLVDTCKVFDFGAKKYAAWNWAKGMAWSIPLACIKRHWLRIAAGEEFDPESSLLHLGHIGCNVVMLVHFLRFFKEGDDRPPARIFQAVDGKSA